MYDVGDTGEGRLVVLAGRENEVSALGHRLRQVVGESKPEQLPDGEHRPTEEHVTEFTAGRRIKVLEVEHRQVGRSALIGVPSNHGEPARATRGPFVAAVKISHRDRDKRVAGGSTLDLHEAHTQVLAKQVHRLADPLLLLLADQVEVGLVLVDPWTVRIVPQPRAPEVVLNLRDPIDRVGRVAKGCERHRPLQTRWVIGSNITGPRQIRPRQLQTEGLGVDDLADQPGRGRAGPPYRPLGMEIEVRREAVPRFRPGRQIDRSRRRRQGRLAAADSKPRRTDKKVVRRRVDDPRQGTPKIEPGDVRLAIVFDTLRQQNVVVGVAGRVAGENQRIELRVVGRRRIQGVVVEMDLDDPEVRR